jgi:hypothetical protein
MRRWSTVNRELWPQVSAYGLNSPAAYGRTYPAVGALPARLCFAPKAAFERESLAPWRSAAGTGDAA